MIVVLFTMKHDKCRVFPPAILTMMGMHIISVGFGTLFPLLFSQNAIIYFSVFLFLFFGAMMIYEAYHLQPKSAEEKVEELQKGLIDSKESEAGAASNGKKPAEDSMEAIGDSSVKPLNTVSVSQATGTSPKRPPPLEVKLPIEKKEEAAANPPKYFCASPYLHLVVLLFLADWGDRCQISAIVLTATHNAWGVAAGGALVFSIIFTIQ